MKTIKSFFFLLLFTITIISCEENELVQFTNPITVNLLTNKGLQVTEGDSKEFTLDVILSKSFNQEIKLTFDLENTSNYPDLLSIETTPVVISKNETKGTLKIIAKYKPNIENILTENTNFKINLISYEGTEKNIVLEGSQTIIVMPEESFTPLTQSQKTLIEHYKSQGIDLTPWIGKIPVEVEVITAAGGGFAPFETSETLSYTGTTYITLSDNATRDKPLLVMTRNAFGLNEYLQYVFRNETILNTVYWNNAGSPSSSAVLATIGNDRVTKWKNKEYDFNVTVDDLELKTDNTVTFIREDGAYKYYSNFLPGGEKYKVSAVNFNYEFELWNELVILANGNSELTEQIQQGGSIHPNNYITGGSVLSDEWEEGNWVDPSGNYNSSDKKMTFEFNIDHSNSGDYDIIKVSFTSPN